MFTLHHENTTLKMATLEAEEREMQAPLTSAARAVLAAEIEASGRISLAAVLTTADPVEAVASMKVLGEAGDLSFGLDDVLLVGRDLSNRIGQESSFAEAGVQVSGFSGTRGDLVQEYAARSQALREAHRELNDCLLEQLQLDKALDDDPSPYPDDDFSM